MVDSDTSIGGISEMVAAFAVGHTSPSEVLVDRLARIASANPALGAVCALDATAATAAREADRRWHVGNPRPLEGVPFGVKDVIQVAGTITTFGSTDFADFTSTLTAELVHRLQAAGAIHVAKLDTYEFAAGPNTRTRNPWDLTRSPGGSSSGPAAAVAARLLPLTVGTDTGGSIRVPAAWCGVVGLKPTRGGVSCHGIAPLSWTLDHAGPLTLSVADAALAFHAMSADAHQQPAPPHPSETPQQLHGMRIGRPQDWFFELCQPAIAELVDKAIADLAHAGAQIIPVSIPRLREINPDAIKHILVAAEAASFHQPRRDSWRRYGDRVYDTLLYGESLTAVDYLRALRLRSLLTREFLGLFADLDALVTPTSVFEAPPLGATTALAAGQERPLEDLVARNTSIFNVCGFPAITVPCGFTTAGLPAGLQIAARPWHEAVCFRIGHAYQHRTGHHLRQPPDHASPPVSVSTTSSADLAESNTHP